MKKLFTVRKVLSFCLLLSLIFTAYRAYYKVVHWGFDFRPDVSIPVWNIDAHVSFKPTGEPIKVALSVPRMGEEFKILNEEITAKGYNIIKDQKNSRLKLSSSSKKKTQNIYYRLTIYDNHDTLGKIVDTEVPTPEQPFYDEQQLQMVEQILVEADKLEGNWPQKVIGIFNQQPMDTTLHAFLPVKITTKQRAEYMINFLALKGIPARLARGVWLEEGKRASAADLMLEAYDGYKWRLYDLRTGEAGLPRNFIVFQHGGISLLDVRGGTKSKVRFSVMKSMTPSIKMAGHRAKLHDNSKMFDYSIYNLPLLEQNTLKWLMVFPLGILVVVLMRNVIGVPTMGTFTPMLIAMSLVKTGFWAGLLCFAVIIGIGLVLRGILSRLNLLLVPRISAVVIFVILIMQVMTVVGYQMNWTVASSAVFFPIIITAWIIERMSITWEEEGTYNAMKEIVFSMLTAIATYFVISSEYIRYLTFAFNEINLVILFVVMLLGTYTGYRLTELKRFSPLAKGK